MMIEIQVLNSLKTLDSSLVCLSREEKHNVKTRKNDIIIHSVSIFGKETEITEDQYLKIKSKLVSKAKK